MPCFPSLSKFPQPQTQKIKKRHGWGPHFLTFRSASYPLVYLVYVFLSSNFWDCYLNSGVLASGVAAAQAEVDVEVADGYTITQFCDKMIDVFMNEKPKSKDWRRFLIFRDEWDKYRERFYNRCQVRADAENDSVAKQKLLDLSSKVRKVWLHCFFFPQLLLRQCRVQFVLFRLIAFIRLIICYYCRELNLVVELYISLNTGCDVICFEE